MSFALISTVVAEALPGDKAARIAELQRGGRRVAMVGDGVNDTPAPAQATWASPSAPAPDVAIETADVVLMRSDPLDVPTALAIGRGMLRKMRQTQQKSAAHPVTGGHPPSGAPRGAWV